MNKLSASIIMLLLLIIIFLVNKFMFQGIIAKSDDGRTAIVLLPSEKAFILDEMRVFLSATQQIVQAVSNDNMQSVVVGAKKGGKAAQENMPDTLGAKLPMAFKKLGLDTHTKFDELAMDAQDMEDKEQTLALLAELMQNCVACHAAYRLDLK